ncbi:UPF0743 protein [Diplonema papillatum]|nr:UPF0743 protein [Diplonema papillatum]
MVSFCCSQCGDIIKKPKVKTHQMRCYTGGFSCVDCNEVFDCVAVNGHTSCVSETERYAGSWLAKQAEEKKKKQLLQQKQAKKRKRSPVRELSSPEWTPEDKPQPSPKRAPELASAADGEKKKKKKAKKEADEATPEPKAAKEAADETAAAVKKEKMKVVTATAEGASVQVELGKKEYKAARADEKQLADLVREALTASFQKQLPALVAAAVAGLSK